MYALVETMGRADHGCMRPAQATTLAPARPATGRRDRTESTGVLRLAAGGVLLGTVGVFAVEAGQDPLTTVWARCAIGGLALLAWGASRGRLHELRLRGTALRAAIGGGALMCASWALFFAAIERLPIGVATVVFHLQPFWLLLLSAVFLGERVGAAHVAATGAALAGLALASGLASPDVFSPGADAPAGTLAGLALCVAGSMAYAGVALVAKTAGSVGSFALAAWQCAVGAVALAFWPLLHGLPVAAPAWGWLAGLGLLHTALAYVLMYAGMNGLPAATIARLQFVYPASAVIVDWAVYGHSLDAVQMLGLLTMAAALVAGRRAGASPP